MEYLEKLSEAVRKSESLLCVGLDPNPDLIPEPLKKSFGESNEYIKAFCREVIDATHENCSAYKPNLAFFEALGPGGLTLFDEVLGMIPDDKIVIADAKRGDINSTAEMYKTAYFDRFGADAITLNPLMGFDTLDPFLKDPKKAIYSLVLTSNSGSNDLLLRRFEGRLSLAEYIADQLRRKTEKCTAHIGMVVGATHPTELELVLDAYPQASLLIPGIGIQGGKIEYLEKALSNHQGIPLFSSSRSILYAGKNNTDWKDDVAKSAKKMRKELKPFSKRFL